MPTLEPGTRFAKYLLVRLLGSGNDAEVWEVIAPSGARRALKVAKPRTSAAPRRQDHAAQEADAIATIEHVHVVRFYDAGLEDGRVWMELELVDGVDLARLRRMEGGKLAVDRAIRLVRQCAEGVAAAHAAGVLHRDLKPGDILVTRDDLAKVADFDKAKVRTPSVLTTETQDPSSALYRAPESMQKRGPEPKSDVYSLAIVLYELLAGENPFAHGGANAMMVCKRHFTWDPPPLVSLSTPVPDELSVLVQQALSKDPGQRPSMREFARRLGVVLSRLDAPRRAAARNLALPNRPFVLARTQPVAEVAEVPMFARGGTIPMAVVQEREASLPPPPSGPAFTMGEPPKPPAQPVTQRSPTFFDPTPLAAPPPVRVAVATIDARRLRPDKPGYAPEPPIEPEAPAERRSTATPVETPAPARASVASPGARRAVLALSAGALALGLAATGGWLLLGRGSGQAAITPPPPAPAAPPPVGSSASAAPAAAPSAEASATRPKAAPGRKTTVTRGSIAPSNR